MRVATATARAETSRQAEDKFAGHLTARRRVHDADLRKGLGRVPLPYALARKCPAGDRKWG